MTTTYCIVESRKQEYIEWLKLWIIKENASILASVERTKGVKPLRHPKGHASVVRDHEHVWLDMLWCQDITVTTCPEEFFQDEWDGDDDSEELQKLVNECFDVAWRAAMPANTHRYIEG